MASFSLEKVDEFPPPEKITSLTKDILSDSDYVLSTKGSESNIILDKIGELLEEIFKPIGHLFEALWDISPVLSLLITIGLIIILFVLIWHIVYSFKSAFRKPGLAGDIQLPEDDVNDPAQWIRLGEEGFARGDYITAVRMYFMGALITIANSSKQNFRKSVTDREYLRRYSGTPLGLPLESFITTIEYKWFGNEECSREDAEMCREALSQIQHETGNG